MYVQLICGASCRNYPTGIPKYLELENFNQPQNIWKQKQAHDVQSHE